MMFAASARNTNAGIAARKAATVPTSANPNAVIAGLQLTIERLKSENEALRKRVRYYDERSSYSDGVVEEIAERHGVPVDVIKGMRGGKGVIVARHHAMYEVKRRFPWMSLNDIGRIFGDRDHSTVRSAVEKWPEKANALGIECLPLIAPRIAGKLA